MAAITDLSTASSIGASDYMVINQSGTDKKVTAAYVARSDGSSGNKIITGSGRELTVSATGTAALIETGTWTPTIIGSTTSGSHTYAVQSGTYWKIGTMVFVRADVAISNKDSGMAGNVQIGGLPYTVAASPKYAAIPLVWLSLSTSYVAVMALATVGQSRFTIYGATAAAASLSIITASAVGNSTEIILTGYYETT